MIVYFQIDQIVIHSKNRSSICSQIISRTVFVISKRKENNPDSVSLSLSRFCAASVPVSSSSVSRRRAAPSAPLSWEKRSAQAAAMSSITIDPEAKPGEFVIKSLFAEFAVLAEKKIEVVMAEPLVSSSQTSVCSEGKCVVKTVIGGGGSWTMLIGLS